MPPHNNSVYSFFKMSLPLSASCYICGRPRVKFLVNKDGYNVVRCANCGLKWVSDPIDQCDLDSFYEETYYNSNSVIGYRNYLEDEVLHRKNSHCLIDEFEKIANLKEKRVLDIGCAAGFFLDEARRLKGCDVYGVEASEHVSNYGREKLGDRLLNCEINESTFPENFFDVVFVIGTIEHLIEPRQILRIAQKIIKPSGFIAITTLDTKCWMPLYSIKPPEHLFYFNHSNLSTLMEQCGFDVVLRKTHFASFLWSDLFYRLQNFFSLSILGTVAKILESKCPSRSIKIPTNEMLIVGEKVSK